MVIKEYISSFLKSSNKDGSSCGVLALAFTHTLTEGKDPSNLDFPDEVGLRNHLFKCIIDKKMAPFYTKQALYNQKKQCGQSLGYTILVDYQIQGMKWYNVEIVMNGTTSRVLVQEQN